MALSIGEISVHNSRVVALIDMDCFYVQVEQRRNPELKGKPCVVVQYKRWRGGGIIAVSYEARKFGVSRNMRGDDAKKKCPNVNLIYVQENRGKADLTIYREAGAEVIKVLSSFSDALERASIDEAYIDLTDTIKRYRMRYNLSEIASKLMQSTHIINSPPLDDSSVDKLAQSDAFEFVIQRLELESNLNLALGAILADEMRAAVLEQTGFTCSAGIAHNKMLAKLVGGMHKPSQQTIIFTEDISKLYETVPIKKIRHLGGKLGNALQETFKLETMKDLTAVPIGNLKQSFGDKTGEWIYSLGQGIDNEPVRIRQLPKSVGCCKNFRGPSKLDNISKVSYWLSQLASEICERLSQELEVNNRTATHMSVSFSNVDGASGARSFKICKVDVEELQSGALKVLQEFNRSTFQDQWDPPVTFLGISASKFEENDTTTTKTIKDFFLQKSRRTTQFQNSDTTLQTASKENDDESPSLKSPPSKSNLKSPPTGSVGIERFFSRHFENASPVKYGAHKKFISNHSLVDSHSVAIATNTPATELPAVIIESETIDDKVDTPGNELNSGFEACGAFEEISVTGKTKLFVDGVSSTANSASPEVDAQDSAPNTFTSSIAGEISFLGGLAPDDFIVCPKCDNKVFKWNLPEHNDFHFAQDLQHNLNRLPSASETASLHENKNASPPRKKIKRSSASIKNFFKAK